MHFNVIASEFVINEIYLAAIPYNSHACYYPACPK